MTKQTFFAVLMLVAFLAGCADSRRPITISLAPSSTQAIDDGQSVTITATLVNDTKKQGVTWAVSGGGSITGQTAASVTYQAPASGGAVNATVTATSVAQTKVTASLTISVSPLPSFAAINLPDATEGVAYSQSVTASGGAGTLMYTLASGALPPGLSLSSTGAITGTSAGPAGKSTFTVKVTDSSMAGPQSATSSTLSINVGLPPAPTITTTSLPGGTVGTAYSQTVTASGGVAPLKFSISAGALPAGLSISSAGAITGTPTSSGTFNFTVKVTDSATPAPQTGTKNLSIQVAATIATLTVTTTSLPNGTVGSAYSATLQSSGGTAPLTWSITTGALPAGLSLNSASGAITGTPTGAGTSNFTVQVADSGSPQQKATKALSITVSAVVASCNPANAGSESLLNGQYAMVLKGFDSTPQPVLVGATFNVDGAGHLATTYGIEESTGVAAQYSGVAIDGAQSSYNLGSDHRGCLKIVNRKGSTQLFRIAVGEVSSGIAARAQVIEADATGANVSGALYLQDPTAFSPAKLKGSYAFVLGAPQPSGSGRTRYAAAGIFTLDGTSGFAGEMDTNNSGTFDGNGTTFPASVFTIPGVGAYSVDAQGRGLISFALPGASVSSQGVIYVISASKFLFLSTDPPMSAPGFVGEATMQTGAPYSSVSMNATSVFGTEGINGGSTAQTQVRVGLLQPQTSSVQYHLALQGSLSAPASFTVDSKGRVSVAIGGSGAAILYLSSPNQGYILFIGQDAATNAPDTTVSSGFFAPQSGAPFNDNTFGGIKWVFGSLGADSPNSTHTEGTATFAPNPPFASALVTGTTDSNSGGTLSIGTAYSNQFTINDPTLGTAEWDDSSLNKLSFGYLISPTAMVAIDSGSNAPALLYYFAQ